MTSTAPNPPRRTRRQAPENGGFGVAVTATPRPKRDAADVGGWIARQLKFMARRAEAGDLQALAELRKLDQVLALETLRAAHGLHVQQGYSWTEIGLAAGLDRTAAFKRWGRA